MKRFMIGSSDDSYALTVEGNKVYYFNKGTGTICIGDLSSALKEITYSINRSNNKIYLQFESMDIKKNWLIKKKSI